MAARIVTRSVSFDAASVSFFRRLTDGQSIGATGATSKGVGDGGDFPPDCEIGRLRGEDRGRNAIYTAPGEFFRFHQNPKGKRGKT
jgi:hypothetical protein